MFKQMRINLSFLTAIFSLALLVSGFFVFNKVEATAEGTPTVVDTQAPIVTSSVYDQLNKTITYTFSEPIQFVKQSDNSTTQDPTGLVKIYKASDYANRNVGDPEPTNWTTSSTLNGTSLIIKYTEDLPADTYLADTWEYTVTDLAGNKLIESQNILFSVDKTAPTAIITHNEKTITYNFSEQVQLLDSDYKTVLTDYVHNLSIYDAASYTAFVKFGAEPTKITSATITDATLIGNTLTITYSGSLVNKTDTSYVIDAWGKNITDMAGNKMVGDEHVVFTIQGDDIAPKVTEIKHDAETKTITYTFSEPMQLISQETGLVTTLDKKFIKIFQIDGTTYSPTTESNVAINSADLNSDSTILTIKYSGLLTKQETVRYIVDTWGYTITDLVGNRIVLDPTTQSFEVAGDDVPPTATVSHDVNTKTITYTFSEDVKLTSQGDGSTPEKTTYKDILGIYELNSYTSHVKGTPAPAKVGTITEASLDGKILTIKYTGDLERTTNTSYVVDAWGYDITDLVGNLIQFDSTTQVFEVKAVKPTAGELVLTTKLHPEGIKSTPNDNGEYLLPDLQMDGADVFNSLTVKVLDINLDTTKVPVYIDDNTTSNGSMIYDAANKIWNYGEQSSRPNFSNGPHTLAATFKDLAGNTTPLVAKFTTDNIAPDLESVGFSYSDGNGSHAQTINRGTAITTEIGRIVNSIGAILTEKASLVPGSKNDISITGPLMGSTEPRTAPYGTFTINDKEVEITPNEGNAVLAHPGIFTFTVDAGVIQDEAGNKNGEVKFVLNVDSDHTAPNLTLNGDNNITVEYKKSYTDQGATFADLVDGAYTVDGTPKVDTSVVGTQIIKYNATDKAGNVAGEITRTVTVVDVTKPVISSHENITAEATSSAGAAVEYTAPIVTDDYDTSVSATCSPLSGSLFALGESVITCKAKDSSNNEAVATTFKITVVDSTAPVIKINGTNPVDIYRGDTYTDAGATATDNYDREVTVTSTGSVDTDKVGIYTITYSAIDKAGNEATKVTRTINVNKRHSSGGSRATPAIPAVPTVTPATPAVPATPGKVLGAEKFNFTLLLKKGMKGDEVMELQKLLNQLGFDCGTADGIFGAKTKAAVIKFQLANKLVGDGIVGPATRAILNK